MSGNPEAGSREPGTQNDRGLQHEVEELAAADDETTAGDEPSGYEPL